MRVIGQQAAVAISIRCGEIQQQRAPTARVGSEECQEGALSLARRSTWQRLRRRSTKRSSRRRSISDVFHLVIELWSCQEDRFHELLETLVWNLAQDFILKVIIVCDVKRTENEIIKKIDKDLMSKVIFVKIGAGARSNVTTLLEIAAAEGRATSEEDDVGLILSNADIQFVPPLYRPRRNKVFALSRREWNPASEKWELHFRCDQQDSWIFSSYQDLERVSKRIFSWLQVPLGKLGTDGRIAQVLRLKSSMIVRNPALDLETRHVHKSIKSRTYSNVDTTPLVERSNFDAASVLITRNE
jgi:hypothetical protein